MDKNFFLWCFISISTSRYIKHAPVLHRRTRQGMRQKLKLLFDVGIKQYLPSDLFFLKTKQKKVILSCFFTVPQKKSNTNTLQTTDWKNIEELWVNFLVKLSEKALEIYFLNILLFSSQEQISFRISSISTFALSSLLLVQLFPYHSLFALKLLTAE